MVEVVCPISGSSFEVTRRERSLRKKFALPEPDCAPVERWRKLLVFHNNYKYFWRTCDETGAKIYSIYAPSAPFKVVSVDYWLNEFSDGTLYGQPWDRSQPFLGQLLGIWHQVPRPATSLRNILISLSNEFAFKETGSYLVFDSMRVKRCLYGVSLRDCEYCVDCLLINNAQHCYECIHCSDVQNLSWSEHCRQCSNSIFLSNCDNCKDCAFCTNLTGKQYYLYNQYVGSEAFHSHLATLQLENPFVVQELKNQFHEFAKHYPIPHQYSFQTRASTGNYLDTCFYCLDSYACRDSDHLINCFGLIDSHYCIDGHGFGENLRESAQFVGVGMNATKIFQSVDCWNNVHNLRFCTFCEDSANLFGCAGIRGKEYCIFNRQYTKDSYFKTVTAITEELQASNEWGKLLPPLFSGFAYNHSSANEFLPLSQAQATLMGYRWDEHYDGVKPSQLIQALDGISAESFLDFPDDPALLDVGYVRRGVFLCEITGKPYRILPEELQLLRSLKVAAPLRCFEQRHEERMRRLAVGMLYQRKDINDKSVMTAFPQNWPRRVQRQENWQREVKRN